MTQRTGTEPHLVSLSDSGVILEDRSQDMHGLEWVSTPDKETDEEKVVVSPGPPVLLAGSPQQACLTDVFDAEHTGKFAILDHQERPGAGR